MATRVLDLPHSGVPAEATGIWGRITTVDHERIGILYGVSAFGFFLLAT